MTQETTATYPGYRQEPVWQPIETAPKDGQSVLLFSESWEMTFGEMQIARWGDDDKWQFDSGMQIHFVEDQDDEDGFDDFSPTHWMPLPGPPQVNPGGESASPSPPPIDEGRKG